VFVAFSSTAADSDFEIRGITFASSTEDVEKALNIECAENTRVPGGYLCKDKTSSIVSENRCWVSKKMFDDLICSQANKPVGDHSLTINYGIIDGVVGRASFEFAAKDYEGIKQAFTAKYGSPTSVKQEPIKTRMGASYNNEIIEWKFKSGTLKLQKYQDNVVDGGGVIRSAEWMKKAKARFIQRKKASASDL